MPINFNLGFGRKPAAPLPEETPAPVIAPPPIPVQQHPDTIVATNLMAGIKKDACEPVDRHLDGSRDPREASWVVPSNVKTVYAEIYDENNKFVDRYTISTYLTFKPGFRLRVIGR